MSDFARLRECGRTQRHPLIILSYAENNLEHNRYGFIAGRRLGKAVKRNRARRLMREAVRCCHPNLHPGYDIVLIARTAIVGQPFEAVDAAVTNLLARAQLFTTAPVPGGAAGDRASDSY